MFRALIPAAVLGASLLVAPAPAQAGEVWVSIDTLSRYQMPDGVGRIVLTNPMVADVQVATATELMVFGRVPGFTDVIFQDADGRKISQVRLRVGNEQAGLVTLYNGAERYSFSCTTRCEQAMVVGDGALGDAARLANQAQVKMQLGAQGGRLTEEAFGVSRPEAPAAPGVQPPVAPGS